MNIKDCGALQIFIWAVVTFFPILCNASALTPSRLPVEPRDSLQYLFLLEGKNKESSFSFPSLEVRYHHSFNVWQLWPEDQSIDIYFSFSAYEDLKFYFRVKAATHWKYAHWHHYPFVTQALVVYRC